MSATHNAVLDELISALEQLRLSRYLCVAAFVLSLYDGILLLGDEYMTIWRTRWTLPKSIYYFNRVVTPIGLGFATFQLSDLQTSTLPPKFCILYIFINSLTELFSFFLSNLLLALRLVALYKRKRWLSWFLYSFLTFSYGTAGLLMVVTLREYGLGVSYSTSLHACASQTRSPLMPVIFIVPLAFEFTLFFLTGLRAWQDAKIVAHSASAPFLHVLYRDGIVCFFVMFGVRIWNIWIYATQPIASAYLGIYLFWAVMTILYTRVYLNLVFLAHRPSLVRTEVSKVQFAPISRLGGVTMQVETTTLGDRGEVVTFGGQAGRPAMPMMTFKSKSGIETTIHAEPNSTWNVPVGKDGSVSSSAAEGDYPSRPASSSSFI